MALWLACWICNLEVLGSNPPPCHLICVWWSQILLLHVNSQMVSLPLVGIFNKFLFNFFIIILLFWVKKKNKSQKEE